MPSRNCKKNWLQSYLDWTDKSEPPELFHMWTGISILGSALGRKVSFPRGHYTLYPNSYIILIAGSAKCRKSTALRMGHLIAKELIDNHKIKVTRNKITPEMLVQELGKEAQVSLPGSSEMMVERGSETLIYVTELTTLIDQKSFQNGLIEILTDLYDCPPKWESKTKTKGCDYLYDVFLSILGATTPEELSMVLPVRAIGSGFTSRIIFVHQRTTDRRFANPEDYYSLPEKVELKEKLMLDLKHIYSLRGEFKWSKEAKELFTTWYDSMPDVEEEKMEGYLGRKHDHAIKVAMILTVSMRDDLVIDAPTIKAAIDLLDEVEKYMSGVYSMLAAPNSIIGDVKWVMKHLLKNGGQMEHSHILRRGWSRFNAESFASVIQSMVEAKMICIQPGTNRKRIYTIVDPEDVETLFD